MKRLVKTSIAFVIMILMLALVACGSDKPADTAEKPAPEPTEQKEAEPEVEKEAEPEKANFPDGKSITMIVPHAAGGGTDLTARAIAKAAEKHLDTTINVVNKTGGGGAVGMADGINAKPDGYTVTMVTVELVTLTHLGLAPFTYEDYASIAQINYDPGSFSVRADAPWQTFEELLEDVKANPGEITVSNSGAGSIWHLNSASVETDSGVEFNHVPFDGAAPGITALLGGHVDVSSASPGEVKQQVEAGELRVLAVSSEERSDFIPDTPTLKELGIITPSIGPWRGMTAPKDTPPEIIAILEDAFLKAAVDPEFVAFMEAGGFGIVVKDAAGFQEVMEQGHKDYKKIIEDLGL